jgi:hypothetical protein
MSQAGVFLQAVSILKDESGTIDPSGSIATLMGAGVMEESSQDTTTFVGPATVLYR